MLITRLQKKGLFGKLQAQGVAIQIQLTETILCSRIAALCITGYGIIG